MTRGAPPIGMMTNRDGLRIPNLEELRMLNRLHTLINDGLSHRKAANQLNNEGFTSRSGGPISHQAIINYLRSAAYREIESKASQL